MLGDNTMACSVKVFIGKTQCMAGKGCWDGPSDGTGLQLHGGCLESSCRAALDLTQILTPLCERDKQVHPPPAQVWGSSDACQSMDCSGNPGKAQSQAYRAPAKPPSLLCHRNPLSSPGCPYCRLLQQMAMATAELLPGPAGATQELSMA